MPPQWLMKSSAGLISKSVSKEHCYEPIVQLGAASDGKSNPGLDIVQKGNVLALSLSPSFVAPHVCCVSSVLTNWALADPN